MRIQTGRGVQGVLTDALSKRIISERVSPRFRAGDFAGGIHDGVEAHHEGDRGRGAAAAGAEDRVARQGFRTESSASRTSSGSPSSWSRSPA